MEKMQTFAERLACVRTLTRDDDNLPELLKLYYY
jgi:hypothetical protein